MKHNFVCSECGHVARDGYNLKRHLKSHVSSELKCRSCNFVHTSKAEVQAHKKTCSKRFICSHCSFTFVEKSRLVRHMKTHLSQNRNSLDPNSESEITPVKRHQCSLCSLKFHRAQIVEAHLIEDHEIPLEKKSLTFDTEDDFYKWKEDMESSSLSNFVVCATTTNVSGEKTVHFRCFRSGFGKFKSTETRKRRPSSLGTPKMGGFCPARLSMKSREGKIFVTYQCTHVGHDFELARLPLSKSYRKYIAEKIRMKIPFREILASEREEAKRNSNDQQLQRRMLLTMLDLHNIARDFRVTRDEILHENEAVSVHDWVERYEECSSEMDTILAGSTINGPTIVIEQPTDYFTESESPNQTEYITESVVSDIIPIQPPSRDTKKEEFLQIVVREFEEIVRQKAITDEDFSTVRKSLVSLDKTLSDSATLRAAQLKPSPSLDENPEILLVSPQKRFSRKAQSMKRGLT